MPAPDLPSPIAAEEIFRTAAAVPVAGRAAYLDAACEGKPELRSRVWRMLEVRGIGALLRQPPDEPVPPEIEAELARLKPEEDGERIGNYKLLQQIGEGGFGIVWMAEQIEPVRRRVALKIIKLGMDTKEVIARFEQERQALAMMDHPNIAKVFDAGATQYGRPFFVMELVRGIRITEYCDQNNLPTAERLALFIQVCRAVQHAHQKGIIHRDLKPSNILVMLHDGVPVPKVIDFGVAKATQPLGGLGALSLSKRSQRLTDLTLFTHFEQMIGTPLYMSPEQAEMSGLDIDTRSDIYSLGVLLYELLTGRTPFDPEELMRKGHDEIRRVIREQEPQKPSTALSTMAAEARTTIAQHRQADSAKLIGLIRGDLDWIVMKALEKDRTRRYETANGLALDLKRHLDHEPVLARPASRLYRCRRLVRRNKLAFSAAALVSVLLSTLAAVSTFSAFRLRAQRNEINEILRGSYLAQARAQRLTDVPGRRTESLRVLALAARMRPSIELRNEAIAALASLDLTPPAPWREVKVGKLAHQKILTRDCESYAVFGEQTGITVHRRKDGQMLAELATPTKLAFKGAFSPDGRYLMAHDTGHPVFVWDLTRKAPGAHTHSLAVSEPSDCAEFTPDSHSIAVSGRDRRLHFYNLQNGEKSLSFEVGVAVTQMKFDPLGEVLALCAGREVHLWQIGDAKKVRSLTHRANASHVAWHPQGRFLAAGYDNGGLLIWNSLTGESWTLPAHTQVVSNLAFDPRGQFLASASWDSTQRFLDIPSGRILLEIKDGGYLHLGSDGQFVDSLREGGGISARGIVRSNAFHALTSVSIGDRHLIGVDFSPDSRWLLFGERSGLHLWDLVQGMEAAFAPSGTALHPLFHPSGRSIVTLGPDQLLRWPLELPTVGNAPRLGPPEILLSVPGSEFQRTAISPDGEMLAVAGHQRSLLVKWNDPSQRVRFGQHLQFPRQSNVSLSPDKRWVAAASYYGVGVTVWNTHDGTMARHLIVHENATVAFSPDSRTLATATARECVLWDTETWQPRHRFASGLFGEVPVPVTFSRDGTLLAVAATRQEVQLIHASTGEPVATLTPPVPLNLESLVFSPDGRHLAAHTLGAVVHLWDLHTLRRELAALGLDW